ncbi:MAG: histidine phosphatase family protein [Erysipelotrichaceae bacterium]|nr:histidine phosphatase family protein [Erysipelotrichaceae bacterium]
MRFILIRHGETYANALYNTDKRILIGALDQPVSQLNEVGIQQAKDTKVLLENYAVDEVYSSDLGRTKQTASIIFLNSNIQYTSLLRERSLGSDEGKTVQEVFSRDDVWKYHVNTEEDSIEDCLNKKVIDGESYIDVMNRCKKFLSQFDINDSKTIAVVSHFHFLRCFIYVLLNKEPDREMMRMLIPNAYPMIYTYENNKFILENRG